MGLDTLGELEQKLLCNPLMGAVYGLLTKFWLKTILSSKSAWLSSIASISSLIGSPLLFTTFYFIVCVPEGVKF